jgi:hypothetical protein
MSDPSPRPAGVHPPALRGMQRSPVGPGTERAVLLAVVLGTALAHMSDDMLNLARPAIARSWARR